MPAHKVIDWTEAMNQVGGDREFLEEVLNDLLQESHIAEEEIAKGVKDDDYQAIMKAAHRIKGTQIMLNYCILNHFNQRH